ncbi:MAG TPA: HD domain-containing protein [Blastocatellia bacterium]|nr:HD domain-containing protein [Blastocatellia bacterium]
MVYECTYDELAAALAPHLQTDQLAVICRAYELAAAVHATQMRDEGTPYILHPLRVARALADELQIRRPALICAALLHDVIEDSPDYYAHGPVTREDLAAEFGEEVAEVVWLLSKFADVTLPAYLAAIEEAAATGAPLVKLCDRLDNLRSIVRSPKVDKIRRYIRTTEIFFLPMAARTNGYLHAELVRLVAEARRHLAEVTRRAS